MAVKIVTDTTADLPSQLAKELGISVVPVYAFGLSLFSGSDCVSLNSSTCLPATAMAVGK